MLHIHPDIVHSVSDDSCAVRVSVYNRNLFLPQIWAASSPRRIVMLLRFRSLMHAYQLRIKPFTLNFTTLDVAREIALTAAPH